MQYYEADIYPMKTKKKPIAVNIILVILSLAVLAFLATRTVSWMGQRDKAKLLTLVNPWNELSGDVNPEFTILEGTQMVDSRCAADLEEMLRDCRAAGHRPYILSSYRAWSEQEKMYQEKVSELMAQGLDREAAEAVRKAARRHPGPVSISWGSPWTLWMRNTQSWMRLRRTPKPSSG